VTKLFELDDQLVLDTRKILRNSIHIRLRSQTIQELYLLLESFLDLFQILEQLVVCVTTIEWATVINESLQISVIFLDVRGMIF